MHDRLWTIYVARALSNLTVDQRTVFDQEYEALKSALRAAGFKIYEFMGFSRDHDPKNVADYDLNCVEMADLVVSLHQYPSDGMEIELGWKCAQKGHVIAVGKKGIYVSNMVRGMNVRNPNYVFVECESHFMEIVPTVIEHFANRTGGPAVFAPGIEQFPDPKTSQPLFRQCKMPLAT